jgi:ATP-dependent helicase/DNAse subunit B
LNTYLACPYKYYLQYAEKLSWGKVPSGVAFGSAMHRAIEEFNKALGNGGMDGAPRSARCNAVNTATS